MSLLTDFVGGARRQHVSVTTIGAYSISVPNVGGAPFVVAIITWRGGGSSGNGSTQGGAGAQTRKQTVFVQPGSNIAGVNGEGGDAGLSDPGGSTTVTYVAPDGTSVTLRAALGGGFNAYTPPYLTTASAAIIQSHGDNLVVGGGLSGTVKILQDYGTANDPDYFTLGGALTDGGATYLSGGPNTGSAPANCGAGGTATGAGIDGGVDIEFLIPEAT